MNFKIDPTSSRCDGHGPGAELKFGSDTDQECLRNGTPKWLPSHGGVPGFGRRRFVLNVTIASHEDPRHGFSPDALRAVASRRDGQDDQGQEHR
ncbi:hypothetical protein [Pseudonocardia sp. Ae717_Ps2]|uniref:hypothetical protein n=1 Tax=Pseudonocardia sp. Ae717_Ps2 TaxID=1885573 RepID=UPI0011866171|nr:hypothetical protein [Pseudonocardia sp. Ae717_Ps2]